MMNLLSGGVAHPKPGIGGKFMARLCDSNVQRMITILLNLCSALDPSTHSLKILTVMATVIPVQIDHKSATEDVPLSAEYVKQWREQGYLLADNIFTPDQIFSTLAEIKALTMANEGAGEFEVGDGKTFPTGLSFLDALSLDHGLVGAVKQLLGADEVRMTQAETWKKVAL